MQRLELARFTRAEVAEQLAGLLGADPPTRLLDDIHTRSQGNPFFAEELLLAGTGEDPGVLTPSLQEVLLARVVRLSGGTQQLLRVAAAAGPGVTQPLLAAVTGMDDQQLLDGLHEAVDQQLLLPEPGRDGYLFRHALLAEAVYSELLAGERVGLHTALAAALEAGPRPGMLQRHGRRGWPTTGWRPATSHAPWAASLRAAAAAEQVYAFAEAQLQLERVLALWGRAPDAAERAGTDRVGVAVALRPCGLRGRRPGPRCAAGPPGHRAGRPDTPTTAGRPAPRAAGTLPANARRPRRAGRPAAGGTAGAVRAVGGAGAGARLPRAVPAGDGVPLRGGEGDVAEEAVAIAAKVGARAEEASACTTLGGALIYLGNPDAALVELAAAVRLAPEAGDVILLLRAILYHSDALLAAGRLDQAATVALDGIQQAHRLGLARAYGPLLACNATEALVALGRWDQAEQVSREALETAPSDVGRAYLPLVRAALELGRGDLDAAQARLQAVQRLLPAPIAAAQRAGPLFGGLAELALWRGDLEQARELVTEAVPLVQANPRYAAPVYASGCGWRPTLPSWPGPATPASQPPTTPLRQGCWSGSPRPTRARPPPACRSWPPGTPSGWPSGPARPAPPTRPAGRPRRPPGSGWASPTGPPTPGSARPRRCWPPATATPPLRCWVAPPPSPAASAPAPSTARYGPWPGAPAWTWPHPPTPRPRHRPPERPRPWSSWA